MDKFLNALVDALESEGEHKSTIDRGDYVDSWWMLGGHCWLVRQDAHGDPLSIQLTGTRETIYA